MECLVQQDQIPAVILQVLAVLEMMATRQSHIDRVYTRDSKDSTLVSDTIHRGVDGHSAR